MTGIIVKPIEPKAICKYCQSENTKKFGFYKDKQRYFCNDCKRKFSVNNFLFKMKTPSNQVSSALSLYYSGTSINGIRNHLFDEYQNHPSSKTVYEWINKYTDEAIKDFRDYHPQVGDIWTADETVLKLKGENIWMYDIIDNKTRFLLATRITTARTTNDAKLLMEKAERVAGKKPKEVLTDKQNSYLDGIELAFGSDTEHVQSNPFASKEGKEDTELIERWHETLKQRTKTMRSLKSMDSLIQFTDGFLVYYNYLRPHEKLNGRTPAEEASVAYPLKNWVDITRNAKPQVRVLTTPAIVTVVTDKPRLFIRPLMRRNYNNHRKPRLEIAPRGKVFRKGGTLSRHHFRGARLSSF